MSPNPGELLASRKCLTLLHGLRERYDIVFVELPPLTFADAAIVTGRSDGTIVVARHRAARARHLRRAVQALTNVNARLLGCVLNMAPSRASDLYDYGRTADKVLSAETMLPTPSAPSEQQTSRQTRGQA